MHYAFLHRLAGLASAIAIALAQPAVSEGQDANDLARTFFHARQIQLPTLCPDGRRLAYVLHSREQDWLWIHDTLTHASRTYQQEKGTRIRQLAWIDDTHVVYATSSSNGNRTQHIALDTHTQQTTRLPTPGAELQIAHPLPMQSQSALLSAVDLDGATALWQFQMSNAELQPATPPLPDAARFLIDSYGKPRIGARHSGSLARLDWGGQKWIPIATPPSTELLDFTDAGASLLAIQEGDERDIATLLAFPSFETREVVYRDSIYDVHPDLLLRDNQTFAVAGFRYQRERPHYAWLDARYQRWHELLLKRFPSSEVRLLGSDKGDERVAAFVSADNEPGHLLVLDLQAEEIQSVRYSGPILDHDALPRTMPFYFLNRNKQRIHGYITLPHEPFKKPFALVVLSRHGPEKRTRWGYDAQKLFFCKMGYAVIEIDPRGTTGYGTAYENHAFIDKLQYAAEDTIDAIRWAAQHGFADMARVGIYGEGFGGYVAATTLASHPELIQCAATNAGIFDWSSYIVEQPKAYLYGDLGELAPRYQTLSPVSRAAQIRQPILLLHAQTENSVSVEHSRSMHRALRQAGAPSTLAITNWGPSGQLSPDAKQDLHLRLAHFFGEHIETR